MNPIWIHHWLNNLTDLAFFSRQTIFVQHSEFGIGPFLVVTLHYTHEYTNVVKFLYIDGHYTNLDGK